MATQFASKKRALGVCDICGFVYKLRELRNTVVDRRDSNIKACPECWDPDHPQLELGERRIYDPQALRDPRPDSAEYAQSRANIIPLRPAPCAGFVGTVTVVIS